MIQVIGMAEKSKNFSQQKGKRGEREVCKMLQPIVDKVYLERGLDIPKLERNLMQSMKGGHDIVGLDWMALEVKHCEVLSLNSWWEQARRQAAKRKVPILLYRKTRCAWWCMVNGRIPIGFEGVGGWVKAPVTISLADFLVYFEKRMIYEIEKDLNNN
jgi:hypothetical protein